MDNNETNNIDNINSIENSDVVSNEVKEEVVDTPVVESNPANEDSSITAELNIRQIDQNTEVKTAKDKKLPIIPVIIIIIGLISILIVGGKYFYSNYVDDNKDEEPEEVEPLPYDTMFDESKYSEVKKYNITINGESAEAAFALYYKEGDINDGYSDEVINGKTLYTDIYLNEKLLATEVLWKAKKDEDFKDIISLLNEDLFKVIYDESNEDEYLLVLTYRYYFISNNLNEIKGLDVYPTIYNTQGKLLTEITSTYFNGSGYYASDATSNLYVDINSNDIAKSSYYVYRNEVHFIKNVSADQTTGMEVAVYIDNGIVSEREVGNISVSYK